MKKILSSLLAFIMLATTITALPITSFAATFTDSDVKEAVTAGETAYADKNVSISEEGGYLLYKVTAEKEGLYSFFTTGEYDTKGYLLSSSALDTDNPIKYNDDAGEGNNCRIEYTLTQGETVYFAVCYYSSDRVDALFNVNIALLPKEVAIFDGVVYLEDTDSETGNDIYCVYGNNLKTPTAVTIRSEINGVPVTYIAENAFDNCKYLTSVVIPGSVKEIGYDAFYDCVNLKSVTLNEGLEHISDWAFGYTVVESVTIPASVKGFNGSAFACCYDLKSISISDANETYKSVDNVVYSKDGTVLIYTLPSLTGTFVVPEGIKSIEYDAFYDSLISEVKLSSTVEYIGYAAFEDCYNLSSVELNEGLKAIDEYAFGYCKKLFSVKLPSTLETIGREAFDGCGLYCVDVPASVTEIGGYAFDDSNIEAIIINNKDTKLSGSFVEGSVIIYGHTGSTAETYANDSGNTFVSIDLEEGVECTHSFVKDEIIAAPSCTSKGLAKTKCAICGAAGENAEIEMLEHNMPVGVCVDCGLKEPFVSDIGVNQSITCTIGEGLPISTACFTAPKDGTYTATISDMNNIEDFVVASNTATNSFKYYSGNETMTVELKAGEQIFVSAMSRKTGASFKATVTCNHSNVSTLNAVPATCTANGFTAGSVCNSCATVLMAQTVVPATGHNFGANATNCLVCGVVNPNYVAPVTQTLVMPKTVKYGGVTYTLNKDGEYVASKAKKSSIKKLVKGKKSFKVTYTKVSKVAGYQVQYSTSKKFTKKTSKKVTYKGNKKFTKTIKKLKGGKKYYVRVRTYKTKKVNGKTVKLYSGWSKAKTVTTKK